MALTCECHWPFVSLIQNGGLILANYADLSRWGDTAMHDRWAGTREAISQPMELNEGHRLPKCGHLPIHIKITLLPLK